MERFNKIDEMIKVCNKYSIKTMMPHKEKNIVDCPFFFVIKSKLNLYTIEPRTESPMHHSTIVKSILSWFYPDLIERYYTFNQDKSQNYNSDKVILENDFINIIQCYNSSVEKIFARYLPNNSNPI